MKKAAGMKFMPASSEADKVQDEIPDWPWTMQALRVVLEIPYAKERLGSRL